MRSIFIGCWRLPCGGYAYAEDGIDDASLPSLQSASETESETDETEYEAGADGASLQSVSEAGTDDGATDNESDDAMTIGQVLDARISAAAHLHPDIFGQTPVVIVGDVHLPREEQQRGSVHYFQRREEQQRGSVHLHAFVI